MSGIEKNITFSASDEVGTVLQYFKRLFNAESDRVDTKRMDKTTGKTYDKMERQPYPPPGSCVAKNSQRPASVETVQGGVPPYGVKETLVVNGKFNANVIQMILDQINLYSVLENGHSINTNCNQINAFFSYDTRRLNCGWNWRLLPSWDLLTCRTKCSPSTKA